MLHVKSLVTEAVKSNGYVVLNADDHMVIQAAKQTKANIIYFSMQEDNLIVHRHIAEGGIAVYLKDNYITLATGNGLMKSLSIMQIPATFGGKLTHNIENCLAAFSAAYALNVPLRVIENALSSFYSNEIHNPGRFNIYNIRDFRVVVDYGHNLAGYSKVIDSLKKMGGARLISIIGVPGDRSDEAVRAIGALSGKSFDRVIIKEDKVLRGREPGEISRLLMEGAISSGLPRKMISLIQKEEDALRLALHEAKAGDIIVVFHENLDCIMDVINDEISKSVDSSSIGVLHRKKVL
jgi:cyanophycin synthetase